MLRPTTVVVLPPRSPLHTILFASTAGMHCGLPRAQTLCRSIGQEIEAMCCGATCVQLGFQLELRVPNWKRSCSFAPDRMQRNSHLRVLPGTVKVTLPDRVLVSECIACSRMLPLLVTLKSIVDAVDSLSHAICITNCSQFVMQIACTRILLIATLTFM